jgi:hypothetical protein
MFVFEYYLLFAFETLLGRPLSNNTKYPRIGIPQRKEQQMSNKEKIKARGSIQRERRRYISFLYIGGSFFLLLVIVAIALRVLYSTSTMSFISKTADAIIFDIAITIGEIGFGSAVIGIIIDQYQRRFSEDEENLSRFIADEGIVDVFGSATDPRLVEYLTHIVNQARLEITFVGLGLSVLRDNREMTQAICNRANQIRSLTVNVLVGDINNAGVANRLAEEKSWHQSKNIYYHDTWPTEYFGSISALLITGLNEDAKTRVRLLRLSTCPILTAAKIDDQLLFFPYGTPNIRGGDSPWVAIDGKAKDSKLANFLNDLFAYYQELIGIQAAA